MFNNGTLEIQNGITVPNENVVLNSTATPALFAWAGDSVWNGLITLMRDSTIGIGTGSSLASGNIITGTGHLTKVGGGLLVLQGTGHNNYSGETYINEGAVFLAKPVAVTAVPSSLNIGTSAGLSATVASYSSYQVIGNIFVNRNGRLNLGGHVENVDHLWLTEGGDVETGTGILFLKTGGSIQVVPGAVGDPSTITGNLDMDAGAHILNVGSGSSAPATANLDITAVMTSSLGAVSLQKNGPGWLRLAANNTYGGSLAINQGVLQVDGSQPSSAVRVAGGAQLMGRGRVGALDFFSGSSAGVVAPGASPGVLSCGVFNSSGAGGALRVELNGTTPGTSGHDQLWVRGNFTSADLTGVRLEASLNFASAVDDQFMILRKDGALEIAGAFVGLSEGTHFYIGDEQFTITYLGGDGNDVVLTRIPTPPRPVLTIQQISPAFVRLLWPAETTFDGFTLQFTTNLGPAGWTSVLPSAVITGPNKVVTNATGDARRFYRLVKP